jgi:hypothetical protein
MGTAKRDLFDGTIVGWRAGEKYFSFLSMIILFAQSV